jgi:hypothetical protein
MNTTRTVLIGSTSDAHAVDVYQALGQGPLVVIDQSWDIAEPFPLAPDGGPVSMVRSVDGDHAAELDLNVSGLRSILKLCGQLLGGVDAVVVTPREWLEEWVTSEPALRLLHRHGVREVVLIESPLGGWERTQLALRCDGTAGVRVSAVRPCPGGKRRTYPDRPGSTVLARNGFGELMDDRRYQKALNDARRIRNDQMAGATWRWDDWVQHEGWLSVSDHPETGPAPLDDLIAEGYGGRSDLRPEVQAVLFYLEAQDYALIEAARTGRRLDAARVSINDDGFFRPGRWEPAGDVIASSGWLRIGKHSRSLRGRVFRVPKGSRWHLETYVSDEGGRIGLRVRRTADD